MKKILLIFFLFSFLNHVIGQDPWHNGTRWNSAASQLINQFQIKKDGVPYKNWDALRLIVQEVNSKKAAGEPYINLTMANSGIQNGQLVKLTEYDGEMNGYRLDFLYGTDPFTGNKGPIEVKMTSKNGNPCYNIGITVDDGTPTTYDMPIVPRYNPTPIEPLKEFNGYSCEVTQTTSCEDCPAPKNVFATLHIDSTGTLTVTGSFDGIYRNFSLKQAPTILPNDPLFNEKTWVVNHSAFHTIWVTWENKKKEVAEYNQPENRNRRQNYSQYFN